ncbi:MAG: transporter substrate-binding domain-containing protein [Holophaga sp.]|nr:transporter substrate-binding domain-containing protein [Holophaga sp.]
MKKLWLLAALVAFSLQAFVLDAQTLKLGTDPTFAPYETKSPSGEIVGFEIDIAKAICQKMGVKPVWVENDFDSIIPALQAKKFDVIVSGMAVNEKRKQQVSFTDKVFHTPAGMVVRKGSGLKTLPESLKGKSVGMQQGTIFEQYARKYYAPRGVTVTPYKTPDLYRADLMAGRLDAVMDDMVVLQTNILSKPEGKDYELAKPTLRDEIFGVGASFGLRKGDTALLQKLNKALAQIRKDGTYAKIAKKYFTFDPYGD